MKQIAVLALMLAIALCATHLYAEPDPQQVDSLYQKSRDSLFLNQGVLQPKKVDTIRYLPPSDLLSLPPVNDSTDSESRLTQNPTSALFRSLLLPGWGQIVNKSYIKAGLYGGLQLYFASRAIHHAREAHDLYTSWEADTSIASRNSIYSSYLVSADARNAHRWYFGITTMISMFDAYVDAHLSGRPRVRQEKGRLRLNELSFDIRPSPSSTGLVLVARF